MSNLRNHNEQRSYDVGYKKPPKHTRFKPGQSGNPDGRPKKSRNVKTQIVDELNRRVTVTLNGKKKEVSQVTSLIMRLIAEAHKGNVRANEVLLRYYEKLGLFVENEKTIDFTDEDLEILNSFRVTQANTAAEPEITESDDEDEYDFLK